MEITLHNNELTGWVPISIEGISDLEVFWIADNQLTGIIPQFISYLDSYAIYNNYFCPPYPTPIILGYQDTSVCIEYIPGNLNNDSILDIFDVIIGIELIINNSELTNYQYWALDLDGDGNHNVNDIIYLVQLIMYY